MTKSKMKCDRCSKLINKKNYIYCRTCEKFHCKGCFYGQIEPLIDQGADTNICINCQIKLSKMNRWVDEDTDLIIYESDGQREILTYHLQKDGLHGDQFMLWNREDHDTDIWTRRQLKMMFHAAIEAYCWGNCDGRKDMWLPGSDEGRYQGFREEATWELINSNPNYHYYGFDPGNPDDFKTFMYNGEVLVEKEGFIHVTPSKIIIDRMMEELESLLTRDHSGTRWEDKYETAAGVISDSSLQDEIEPVYIKNTRYPMYGDDLKVGYCPIESAYEFDGVISGIRSLNNVIKGLDLKQREKAIALAVNAVKGYSSKIKRGRK